MKTISNITAGNKNDSLPAPHAIADAQMFPEACTAHLSRDHYHGRHPADLPCPAPSDRSPIEDLLIKLAKACLKDELHTEWIDMEEAARICRANRITLACRWVRGKDLDYYTHIYFEHRDKLMGDGVKVVWKTDATDKGMAAFLKFHRIDPANDYGLDQIPPPES